MVKIVKFGQNCEIWPKLWNLVNIVKFGRNSEIWLKFWNLVKILKFGQNSEIWLKFWNLVKIQKFGMVWYEFVWFGHNSEAECWKRLCNPQPWINQWLTDRQTDKGGHRAAMAAKNSKVDWMGTINTVGQKCLGWDCFKLGYCLTFIIGKENKTTQTLSQFLIWEVIWGAVGRGRVPWESS